MVNTASPNTSHRIAMGFALWSGPASVAGFAEGFVVPVAVPRQRTSTRRDSTLSFTGLMKRDRGNGRHRSPIWC